MEIRAAHPDDADAVAELLGELGYPSDPRTVATRLRELGDGDRVLLADGGLVTVHRVPLLTEGGAALEITALVVAPTHRGSGLGRALLAAAEDVAREWGCHRVQLSSSRRPARTAAHAFYPAAGYEDAATRSVRYTKQLGPRQR